VRRRAAATADRSTSRPRAHRRVRGERGAALVELALILPLFVILVFGVIEFGLTYNNYITIRQGVREADRQGAVGNFGSITSCSLQSTPGNTVTTELACLTKQQIGLSYANTRVKIMSGDPTFTTTGSFSAGDSLIICAMYPIDGTAKFVSPVLGKAFLKSKTTMRIETSYSTAPVSFEETPLTGQNWSWCTVSGAAP
jgi:Flp pilus assembly protein TadG